MFPSIASVLLPSVAPALLAWVLLRRLIADSTKPVWPIAVTAAVLTNIYLLAALFVDRLMSHEANWGLLPVDYLCLIFSALVTTVPFLLTLVASVAASSRAEFYRPLVLLFAVMIGPTVPLLFWVMWVCFCPLRSTLGCF